MSMNVAEQRQDAGPPSADGVDPENSDRRGFRSVTRLVERSDESSFVGRYALIGIWLVVAAIYAATKSNLFLTSGTFQTIFSSQDTIVFLGMAALLTLAVGEFDLSIASNLGLGAILMSVLIVNHHWPAVPAILVALAACSGVGLLNAIIVVRLDIDPIITTLGMGTLILGITEKISGGTTIAGLSKGLAQYANANFLLQLPVSFYYGLALAAIFAYVLRFTSLGRHMTFVGANREVARLAGVRVTRIRMGAYLVAGLLAGLGGVLLAIGNGGMDPTSSGSYLLPAYSAAFLGTAAIKPGRFNPIGTMVAIYFLSTGITGLQLLGGIGWISDVFYGGALILAIVLSTIARRRTLHRT
jgi:ribose transport system permease protein